MMRFHVTHNMLCETDLIQLREINSGWISNCKKKVHFL